MFRMLRIVWRVGFRASMYFIPVWDVVVLFHLTLGLCGYAFCSIVSPVSPGCVLELGKHFRVGGAEIAPRPEGWSIEVSNGWGSIEFVNIGRQEMMPLTSRWGELQVWPADQDSGRIGWKQITLRASTWANSLRFRSIRCVGLPFFSSPQFNLSGWGLGRLNRLQSQRCFRLCMQCSRLHFFAWQPVFVQEGPILLSCYLRAYCAVSKQALCTSSNRQIF